MQRLVAERALDTLDTAIDIGAQRRADTTVMALVRHARDQVAYSVQAAKFAGAAERGAIDSRVIPAMAERLRRDAEALD